MYKEQLNQAAYRPATEFEIQSDCYQLLKTKYPLVRGEIKIEQPRAKSSDGKTIRNGGVKVRRDRGARFDLVVYDRQATPLFTIEVKRKETYHHTKKEHYELLSGVPSYLVGSLAQLKELLASFANVKVSTDFTDDRSEIVIS